MVELLALSYLMLIAKAMKILSAALVQTNLFLSLRNPNYGSREEFHVSCKCIPGQS